LIGQAPTVFLGLCLLGLGFEMPRQPVERKRLAQGSELSDALNHLPCGDPKRRSPRENAECRRPYVDYNPYDPISYAQNNTGRGGGR
jgi:hypothetical protein